MGRRREDPVHAGHTRKGVRQPALDHNPSAVCQRPPARPRHPRSAADVQQGAPRALPADSGVGPPLAAVLPSPAPPCSHLSMDTSSMISTLSLPSQRSRWLGTSKSLTVCCTFQPAGHRTEQHARGAREPPLALQHPQQARGCIPCVEPCHGAGWPCRAAQGWQRGAHAPKHECSVAPPTSSAACKAGGAAGTSAGRRQLATCAGASCAPACVQGTKGGALELGHRAVRAAGARLSASDGGADGLPGQ